MATEFPDPRWAVEGLIPEGLTLLVGAPKVGKSWLGLGLGVAVASGGKAFGKIQVEQGPALVLALEDTPRRLKSRLGKILIDAPAPKTLTISVECPRLGEGAEERIEGWITANPDARLVVIDVLAKIRTSGGMVGESAYAVDYRAISQIKALSDQYGVPFVVLHHPRKTAADDWIDVVSGTAAIAGSADSIALLKRTRGKADGILSITGRDVDESEHALRFDADIGSWILTDTPVAELRRTENENAIIGWLTDHEGDSPMKVANGAGLEYEATKKAMRRLTKRGALDSDGKGHYWVPIEVDP